MKPETSTLLVVDDNEANRTGLSQLFRLHGYEVCVAKDGRHALEFVRRQPCDLVLLDIMMAGLSGLDVLKQLRTSHPPTELPVIMATALGASADIVHALRLGANDYITKPIDFAVLLARVQTQLSLRHAVQRIIRLEHHLTQRNEELQGANSKLQAANTRMEHDLKAAASIQEAFLPPKRAELLGIPCAWL